PRVPASHWLWHGGNGAAAVIVWYVIALGTMVDPGFWQRAYAARDPRVARNGVLWSIAFWILFDFMTTACGLYARALLPRLEDPVYAFPTLANLVLPPVALGLMSLPGVVTLGWVLWKSVPRSKGLYPFAIEPIYAGLACSLLVWGVARLSGEESLS